MYFSASIHDMFFSIVSVIECLQNLKYSILFRLALPFLSCQTHCQCIHVVQIGFMFIFLCFRRILKGSAQHNVYDAGMFLQPPDNIRCPVPCASEQNRHHRH